MGWNDSVMSQPEAHNLVFLGEMDRDHESYQFDECAVWMGTDDGLIYYGFDSGCSCPSPFENYDSREKLEVAYRYEEFERSINDWLADGRASSRFEDAGRLKRLVREKLDSFLQMAREVANGETPC